MKNELKDRSRLFAIDVIKFCQSLSRDMTSDIISRQLIRCSTSVGANYRAACRAKSTADFINKLKIVEEECDECIYFLEICKDLMIGKEEKVIELIQEADELLRIFVASLKTSRENHTSSRTFVNRKS